MNKQNCPNLEEIDELDDDYADDLINDIYTINWVYDGDENSLIMHN